MKQQRPRRKRALRRPEEGLPPETNPELRDAILAVVDKQLASGNPPETNQTHTRLVLAGYTREGARQLIAHVVVREIFAVMSRGERYDAARYYAALARLPELPDEP
jgi:hypothetical protein